MLQFLLSIFHKFHLVTKSPWPIFISLATMNFLVSFLMFFLFFNKIYYLLSLLFLLYMYFVWWRDVNRESNTGFHNFSVRDGLKWGMLLFLFSEVMFFFAWFWAFFHNSLTPSNEMGSVWPPFSVFCLEPFQIPLLNTFILLSSGATVTVAHHMLVCSENSFPAMMSTIILGMVFTSYQLMEYKSSLFSMSESAYGSSFFVTTGFHGIHVLIGTLFLACCAFFTKKMELNKWNHISMEFAIWYWHFVDVVWLFLYFFIYWWGY